MAKADVERQRACRARRKERQERERAAQKAATARKRAPRVLTHAMREMLAQRSPKFERAVANMFTALMVVCAFCGTCNFRWTPTLRYPGYKLLPPRGECGDGWCVVARWIGLALRTRVALACR